MSYEYFNNASIKTMLLAFSQVKGMGYFSIRKLYERFRENLEIFFGLPLKDIIQFLEMSKIKNSQELAENFFKNRKKYFENAEKLWINLQKRNIHFLLENDIDFPRLLRLIPDRPFWLFVEGNVRILNRERCIAVVGSRNPTDKGMDIAYTASRFLVDNRFIIVSGLAEGIDEVAHIATLDGAGFGIGILGHGINLMFPARTAEIRKAIAKNNGAIITEFFPNEHYNKRTFVWRDRLQSGLCEVIIPVQGTYESGTFHTVRYAESQRKKIIGVYKSKIEDIPQNDVLKYIKEKKYPAYNLANKIRTHKLYNDLEKYYEITLFELKNYYGNKDSNI